MIPGMFSASVTRILPSTWKVELVRVLTADNINGPVP